MFSLLLAGCGNPARPPPRTAAGPDRGPPLNTNTDPCAMRMHDICGPLLLYYATHHQLPDSLEALTQMPGFENIRDFTCPVSGQPYIYDPEGILNPDAHSHLIVYDPLPSHAGMRWAISVLEPTSTGPLIAKVLAVREQRFTAASRPAS